MFFIQNTTISNLECLSSRTQRATILNIFHPEHNQQQSRMSFTQNTTNNNLECLSPRTQRLLVVFWVKDILDCCSLCSGWKTFKIVVGCVLGERHSRLLLVVFWDNHNTYICIEFNSDQRPFSSHFIYYFFCRLLRKMKILDMYQRQLLFILTSTYLFSCIFKNTVSFLYINLYSNTFHSLPILPIAALLLTYL
jgi:hypothetical protein